MLRTLVIVFLHHDQLGLLYRHGALRLIVQQHFLCLFVTVGDGVAFLLCQTVEVPCFVVFLSLRMMKTCAAKEIKTALTQLLAYSIIMIALAHVRVEGSRRSMVDSNRRHDADSPSLRLQFHLCGWQTRTVVAGPILQIAVNVVVGLREPYLLHKHGRLLKVA